MITDTASTIPLQVHPMIFHFITAAVSFILCIPKYNPIADTTSKIHPPAPLNGLLVPPVFMEPKSGSISMVLLLLKSQKQLIPVK